MITTATIANGNRLLSGSWLPWLRLSLETDSCLGHDYHDYHCHWKHTFVWFMIIMATIVTGDTETFFWLMILVTMVTIIIEAKTLSWLVITKLPCKWRNKLIWTKFSFDCLYRHIDDYITDNVRSFQSPVQVHSPHLLWLTLLTSPSSWCSNTRCLHDAGFICLHLIHLHAPQIIS